LPRISASNLALTPPVLNKLLNRLRSNESATDVAEAQLKHDPAQLALLFRHFPVGARLSYFFDDRREFQFDTLVIGYRINDHLLHAKEGVQFDDDDLPCAFRIDAHTVVPVAKLDRLRLMLPDTSADQNKLDIVTRSELGRDGHLRKGATLTLRARTLGRGVPTMETTVDRKETLADGPFAGQATVLVEPDLEMIRVVDNRRKPRVKAAIAAALLHGAPPGTVTECLLVDFSEETLRLKANSGKLPALRIGSVVEVLFAVPPAGESYRLRGKVSRQSEQGAVIRFAELHLPASSDYRKIDTLDVLEIKTRLLNARG
jgi:hypothetical protein